jgi:hypothetical protein
VRWAGKFDAKSFPDKMKTKLGRGEMAEWLKARASKACIPLRVSGVRIPLSPPVFKLGLMPLRKQGSTVPSDLCSCLFGPGLDDLYLRR